LHRFGDTLSKEAYTYTNPASVKNEPVANSIHACFIPVMLYTLWVRKTGRTSLDVSSKR